MKESPFTFANMITTIVASKQDYETFNETKSIVHSQPSLLNRKEATTTTSTEEVDVDFNASKSRDIIDGFIESYFEALRSSPNSMIPTFSTIPSGNENGVYLAIDLGGSTLRVAVVEVSNKKTITITENSWLIKDNQKLIDQEFFAMIALRIKCVLSSQDVLQLDQLIHCGMTWSFPLRQTKPNNGLMENVSKGYHLTSYSQGQDLKILLEKACKDSGIQLSINAIINDSISVFVAGKFLHNNKIGIVLGTGTNAAVPIPQLVLGDEKKLKNSEAMCLLNSELSFFGHHLKPLANSFDSKMDKRWNLDFSDFHNAPHMNTSMYGVFQPLELMTSGRYISELARLQIIDKCSTKQMNIATGLLSAPFTLDAESICDIYENSDFDRFEKLYDVTTNEKDRKIITKIIDSIIDRGIYVLGLAIVALLEILNGGDEDDVINIGYVGSILQFFHTYRKRLEEFINTQQTKTVKFVYVDNSSVNGAAIAAAVNVNK